MQTGVNSLSVPIGTHRWWWSSDEGELEPIQVTVTLVTDESEIEAYEQRLEEEESWALEGYGVTPNQVLLMRAVLPVGQLSATCDACFGCAGAAVSVRLASMRSTGLRTPDSPS